VVLEWPGSERIRCSFGFDGNGPFSRLEEGQRSQSPHSGGQGMELGAFSISLAVKDLAASRAFYEKFGFKAFAGNPSQNWLILKNGDHVIGLFQGMFDRNILTFNPGWDQNAQQLPAFTDVRDLQRQLKAHGVQLVNEADESTTGPASFIAVDPDGNPILVDQHV
jgi:predicted enzyme related to lactoylglutathione lyase